MLVAPKQHIAVRSADDDAHFIRKATVFGVCIERFDVHGGSDVVAFEPQDEFEDMAVGLGADGAVVGCSFAQALSSSSSLRKMPRYCTEGQSVFKKFCGRKSASLFLTGTSAKKYHGETPKRRERS